MGARKQDGYELNDHDSSTDFRNHVRKEYDKCPLKKQICERVDEFNRCKDPRQRDRLRREIETLDKVRRDKDLEKLRK